MIQNIYVKGSLILLLSLAACSAGKWVHPINNDAQALQDWDTCKAEVLAGTEYLKETMAGGINLSGCMHSKGYRYVEEESSQSSSLESPTLQ